MGMNTGENDQGLKKIVDMTRFMSIAVLFLHFYYVFYQVFEHWMLVFKITDNLLKNILKTEILTNSFMTKAIALAALLISLLGVKGRKTQAISYGTASLTFGIELMFYFGSVLLFFYSPVTAEAVAIAYMIATA